MSLDYTSYPLKRSFFVTPDEQSMNTFNAHRARVEKEAKDVLDKINNSVSFGVGKEKALAGIDNLIHRVADINPLVKVNVEESGISQKNFLDVVSCLIRELGFTGNGASYADALSHISHSSLYGSADTLTAEIHNFDNYVKKSYVSVNFAQVFYHETFNESNGNSSIKIAYSVPDKKIVKDMVLILSDNELDLFKDVWNDRLEKSVHRYLAELDSMSTVIPNREILRREKNARDHMRKLYMS